MKKVFLLLAIIGFITNANAHANKSVSKDFATTVKTSVAKENSNTTTATTSIHKTRVVVLPLAAQIYLKENHKSHASERIIMVTGSNGVVSYQVIVGKKDFVFDSKGNYLTYVKY